MSDRQAQGEDPVDVDPTDNSSGAPVDMTRVEEIEEEEREREGSE